MESNKQMSLFSDEFTSSSIVNTKSLEKEDSTLVSENIKDAFNTMDVPYIGCDYEASYPKIAALLPKETYTFNEFNTETAIRCEIICAAICHQMNWDFLRRAVYEETIKNPEWLDFYHLKLVDTDKIFSLLHEYHKQENIKANERAELLHIIGAWGERYDSIKDAFVDKKGDLRQYRQIHDSLLKCSVFATDPAEKKLNLLLQKLDGIELLKGIANYAKPTIDYHLIRLYLRRGLLIVRTKHALHYITNQEAERKESTVAAIRELCSKILCQISAYTNLNISAVNTLEWNIARSVCHRENPDCELKGKEGEWLKKEYCKCPFYESCSARVFEIDQLLKLKEPLYKGTSY